MLKNNPVLFTLLFAACLSCWISCTKKEITPQPEPTPPVSKCGTIIDTTILFDVDWEHKNYMKAPKRRFRKDRFYFENDSLMGTWKISMDCFTTIEIKERYGRAGIPEPLVYTIKIIKLNKDTLWTTEWDTDFYTRKK